MSRAYYNEFDPKAAAWLRELIAEGLIAPGDVDDRSIADVVAGDLAGYTQCHFFAGIGGWSLALRLAGWPDDRPVWTGSCPCQPFSAAGKGAGAQDARHLWPEFGRLIAECRPPVVFGEQVASAAGRDWLTAVRLDLEALGYGVGAADLCAASVGAPHIRQRLWWVADALPAGRAEGRAGAGGGSAPGGGPTRGVVNAEQPGPQGQPWHERDGHQPGRIGADPAGSAAEAGTAGFWSDLLWLPCRDGKARPTQPVFQFVVDGLFSRMGTLWDACQQAIAEEIDGATTAAGRGQALSTMWETVAAETIRQGTGGQDRLSAEEVLLIALCEHARRLGPELNGTAPSVRQIQEATVRILRGQAEEPQVPPCASPEWRLARSSARELADAVHPMPPAWGAWRTRLPALTGQPLAHGVPGRVGLLRGAGNAIVPQVAAAFIEAYLDEVTR